MNWRRLEKDLDIELSPVRNDICVVYHYGEGPWGLKKIGAGLIKRYFNHKAELFLSSDEGTLAVRETISEAREAVNFMFDHNKEENYYAQIYPIADDAKPRKQKKPDAVKKKPLQKRREITREVYGWVLTGSLINWQTALEHNIWGTHSAHKESWDKLKEGV